MGQRPEPNLKTDSDPANELSPLGITLLQQRLTTYAIVVLVIALSYWPAFYWIWGVNSALGEDVVLAHILSRWTFFLLLLHASLWLTSRIRRWSPVVLASIDVAYHFGIGLIFGQIILNHPSPVISVLEGLLALTSVLAVRALLVPSSGLRTALVGGLTCLGPVITLFQNPEHFSASWMQFETSSRLYVNWATIAVVLSSVASMVLYGLRREVRNARRLGQYTLVERLGEGGMGIVYRAEHAFLRRPTAVKLLLSTERIGSLERFQREVQLMAELTHPNTVAIYDYGRTARGVFYYAMEYLHGVDLEGLVAVAGPQPPARVIHLLRQACGSLDEAHRRGLVHRDIKPANLFLCKGRSEPDTLKVLDFGLVKDLATKDPGLSAEQAVLGTPLYMAPETLSKQAAIGPRSDLYSLGAVGYFLLTGTPVFQGASVVEVCFKQLHGEPERAGQRLGAALPSDLESLVMSCLAKAPEQRPASARALGDALEACADARGWRREDAESWWDTHGSEVEKRRQERAEIARRAGRSTRSGLSMDATELDVRRPLVS